MDHYSVDIEYDEESDQHHLNVKPLTPIPDGEKYEKKKTPSTLMIIPNLHG